jgi:hypothetical protein
MVKLLLSALRWAGVFGLNLSLGGGGGGKTPANTTQTVINDVAPWAREAAKETLAKGMALTNKGYEAYGGDRLAEYDPMQEQAYQGARDMTTASQLDDATRMAMQSGNYNPADFQNQYRQVGESWNPNAAQQYMSPYMEAALNPQLRAAALDSQLAQMKDQAAAVGRGAFGGSRTAIGQGMREQGLMQNLGDIRAKGYQTAYEQAANQFQADQSRKVLESQLRAQYGLSADQAREQSRQFGSTAGLNAANTLSNIGQTQFQQGMDINKLRNTYGAQKQARDQKAKDLAYQNWADQKNWEWEQVMRRADLLNKTPTGSSSTTSMYKAAPTAGQNLAAAGTAAYGASQLFARGGLAYAGGGITDEQHVEGDIIPSLSNDQLQAAYGIAKQTGDIRRANAIAEVLQSRGVPVEDGAEGGAEAPQVAPNSISAMATPDMVNNIVPTQEGMANGGIVAFAGGGGAEDDTGSYEMPRYESAGNNDLYRDFGQYSKDALEQLKALKAPVPLTRAERLAAAKQNYADIRAMDEGPDPYADIQAKLANRTAMLDKRAEQAKGLAALAALPKITEGGVSLSQALAGGIGAAAQSYGNSLDKNSEQRNANEEIQFQLAKAKQLEARGMHKEALDAVTAAEAARVAMYKEDRTTGFNQLIGAARASQAFRPVSSGGSRAPQPKFDTTLAKAIAADLAVQHPDWPATKINKLAYESAAAQLRDKGISGVVASTTQAAIKTVADQLISRRGREAAQKLADDEFGGDLEAAKAHMVEQVTAGTPIEDILSRYQSTVGNVGGGGGGGNGGGGGGGGGAKPRVIKLD